MCDIMSALRFYTTIYRKKEKNVRGKKTFVYASVFHCQTVIKIKPKVIVSSSLPAEVEM